MQKSEIIIVEDDSVQREALTFWLTEQNYQVHALSNGRSLIRYLSQYPADLIILDWNLPDVSGVDLLIWLRQKNIPTPVIFHTVHDCDTDVVAILNSGADDFLIKPIARSIMIARVQAILRRRHTINPQITEMRVGSVTINRRECSLSVHGQKQDIGEKELGIAWELGNRVGQVVKRPRLLMMVWGLNETVETRTLDMYISRLRNALKKARAHDWQIRSIYGIGYRLELESKL